MMQGCSLAVQMEKEEKHGNMSNSGSLKSNSTELNRTRNSSFILMCMLIERKKGVLVL